MLVYDGTKIEFLQSSEQNIILERRVSGMIRKTKRKIQTAVENRMGITRINYGEIHIYYPLQFDKECGFEELCEKIEKSVVIASEEYENVVMSSVKREAEKFTRIFNEKLEEENVGVNVKVTGAENFDSEEDIVIGMDDIRCEFEEENNIPNFRWVSMELETLQERYARMESEYEQSSNFCSKNYLNYQTRFILRPLKIELNNGEKVWLQTILYLFANNMGIIKLEIPIRNVDVFPLEQDDVMQYVNSISCSWNKEFCECTSLWSIVKKYLDVLYEKISVELLMYDDVFQNIILVDYVGMPDKMSALSPNVQESLYKISISPIPNIPNASYKEKAKEYLKRQSWGVQNVKYLLKTTGGCLAFGDQTLLEMGAHIYGSEKPINEVDELEYIHICGFLAKDLQVNAEMSILHLMLKKINQRNLYFEKIYDIKDVNTIKKEYSKNVIFLCELREKCYGSVKEQIKDFERFVPYYMEEELTAEKINAIDAIIESENAKKVERVEKVISLGGFWLAVILGLPSIYDTVSVLRKCAVFINTDIPIITLENVSVALWLLIIFGLCKKLFNGKD